MCCARRESVVHNMVCFAKGSESNCSNSMHVVTREYLGVQRAQRKEEDGMRRRERITKGTVPAMMGSSPDPRDDQHSCRCCLLGLLCGLNYFPLWQQLKAGKWLFGNLACGLFLLVPPVQFIHGGAPSSRAWCCATRFLCCLCVQCRFGKSSIEIIAQKAKASFLSLVYNIKDEQGT